MGRKPEGQCMNARATPLRRPYSGIYSVPDAALYLRATTPPPEMVLRLWEKKRRVFIGPNSRHLYAWIRRGVEDYSGRDIVLTFEELVRMRMIVILRSRGLSLPAILSSESYIRSLTGSPQPFVTESLWSSSSDIFLEFMGLLAVTKQGQLAMEFLKEYLLPVHHGLEFDAAGISAIWRPMPGVLIDPDIQFGAPCIEGTRVETEAIWSFHQTGETIDRLASWYAVDRQQIEAAIEWEATLARAA
ncbi:MAG: DUF433 domain-containing protein [Dehalococcoidia bacterium]|nr:DUF433 domain-containing protein [Dehalococcoidia bacterium]